MDEKRHKGKSKSKTASPKDQQLAGYRARPDGPFLTTNQGGRITSTDDSLKAGPRGPTLMEDFHFREKMTHFDHERIPERVVHARGSGAHGYFEAYEPLTQYTKARFLQDPSLKTPTFVRFSTVVGSRGSADTVRDVRGFATKFYTQEGNYDLVANNIPIFFIQDAIKFPDIVHAIKPEPHNEIPQASAAHDTFWDFVVNLPEITHMIMWLLSDRAIPRSYRMMQGFGVNTFRLVNDQGQAHFVKFHWVPMLGTHSLVWDEAQKIAGKDPDYNRRDLWTAIENGDYPEYELGIQLIPEADEFKFDFDVLDPTKIWPEELIPVKVIGKMTLNRNPDNFFAETEQVAFHPAHIVPGIDFTNDPLLQGRLFSYLDTQLIRLGGPNFPEIPINRPLAPVDNNQRDGFHRMTINVGQVSYHPNSLAGGLPRPAGANDGGYLHHMERVDGRKIRDRSPSFQDFYSQATLFWNSMAPHEQKHIVEAFHFEVGKVQSHEIRQQVVDMFNNVDADLARQIAEGVGVEPPEKPGGTGVTASSPAVSQANTAMSPRTRMIAVLASDGVDFDQLGQVVKALDEAGAYAKVISKNLKPLKSLQGPPVRVNESYTTTASVLFDAVYVPGGQESLSALKVQGDALHFVNEAFKHAKPIGATAEGIDLLAESDVQGVTLATNHPEGRPVSQEGVVTAQNPSDMAWFCEQFVEAIKKHRHWTRETRKGMVPA